jgi:mannosyltransferase
MKRILPDYIVLNLHKRYTGVSATIKHLVPIQQQELDIAVVDFGNLNLKNTWSLVQVILYGWTKPMHGNYRVWHARRDVDMIIGIILKYVLRQKWKLLFTSAAPKKPGYILNKLIKNMDAIIATSKRAANFIPWHSIIIHHGVDTSLFKPRDTNAKTQNWIGSFGRIRDSKGSDLLVKALIEVLPKNKEWSAFFSGLAKDISYKEDLENIIEDAGLSERIIFLGDQSQEQIYENYNKCSIVAACSRVEGFGLTPLEAMASGVAALTSKAGFWPELIIPGENGNIFETNNLEDLIQKLNAMLKSKEKLEEMGIKARKYVVEKHSIENEAKQINLFYKKIT